MCLPPGVLFPLSFLALQWNRLSALHPCFDNAAFAVCIFISSRTDPGAADLMTSAQPDMAPVEVHGLNNMLRNEKKGVACILAVSLSCNSECLSRSTCSTRHDSLYHIFYRTIKENNRINRITQ